MKQLQILFTALVLFSACSSKEESGVILDVRAVMNKKPSEVIEILGPPDSTYTEKILGHEIFCQRYREHNIEIQYPDSVSTDIVVYGPHGLPFNQTALKAFKLPYQKRHPSQHMKESLMRWYDFDEFEAISMYNVDKDTTGAIRNFNIYFKAKQVK
jgi:hypothetical protein